MSVAALVSRRAVILLAVSLAFACVASADTVYDVSGTFLASGSSNPTTGPFNGGTFSGTFSATLPISSGLEVFSAFNINLISSSGATLFNLTNISGGVAAVSMVFSNCSTSSSTTGPCDAFDFGNEAGLQLLTPTNFTGGSVYVGLAPGGVADSFAYVEVNTDGTDSLVASGSIEPVPEPGWMLLLGLALLGGLWFGRRRLFA